MSRIAITLLFAASIYCSPAAGFFQQTKDDVHIAPNAPSDKNIQATEDEVRRIEAAIKPYVKRAKLTYPAAKKRFLRGLPPDQSFFVTTRLRDKEGRYEQVFVAVERIRRGLIEGRIWSDVRLLKNYKHGDRYTFPESDLLDWTITRPDGTEEGNFVGKFLDDYQRQ